MEAAADLGRVIRSRHHAVRHDPAPVLLCLLSEVIVIMVRVGNETNFAKITRYLMLVAQRTWWTRACRRGVRPWT